MLKNLKSLFFVEDEKKPSKKEAIKTTRPTPGKSAITPTPSTPINGEVSDKFTKVLFQAIEQNNLQGFDYLEFRQSLLSLKKVQLDEATRFQSAAAMAASMGVTGEQLAKSAQHYLSVLKQEHQKFNQALKNQKQNQIGSKEQQLKQIDETVKAKTAKIRQLTKEIEQHQKEAVQLRKNIDASTVKVRKTAADFSASYQSLVGQIQEDVEKIKQYLK